MKIKSIIAIAVASGVNLLGVLHSQAQMVLSAGIGTPLNSDYYENIPDGNFRIYDHATLGTYQQIQLRLDLGSVKEVELFLLTNSTYLDSNVNTKNVTIRVAADESDPGFDLNNVDSYTVEIFSGLIVPFSNVKGTVRNIDITDTTRQYFLFSFTDNIWGEFTHANIDRRTVIFNDIQAQVIPEPSTILLMLSGLGCLAIFRRRVHH